MKIKKILLLAMAALCAVAVAVPSAASAEAFWIDEEGFPLEENAEVALNGSFGFITQAGGIECGVTAAAILEPGESGTLTELGLENCEGNGVLAAPCTTKNVKVGGLPMTIHADTSTAIQITNVFFTYELDGGTCKGKDVSINSTDEVFAVPSIPEEFYLEVLDFGGGVATSLLTPGLVYGGVVVFPGAAYGIWSE